jgi:hypothetical protein
MSQQEDLTTIPANAQEARLIAWTIAAGWDLHLGIAPTVPQEASNQEQEHAAAEQKALHPE